MNAFLSKVLIVSLDQDFDSNKDKNDEISMKNMFLKYLSRIHREDDYLFILSDIKRLLINPLRQTYLPGSQ